MNLQTSVYVTLKLEGIHNFEGAVKDQFNDVNYLAHPHRHIFGFELELEVTHDDRDVEFLQFKRLVREYLELTYWNDRYGLLDFTGESCEMLAKELIHFCKSESLQPIKVKVDEDGENGATVRVVKDTNSLQAVTESPISSYSDRVSQYPNLLFIVGYTGVGKSTLAQALSSNDPKCEVIEVSKVVRDLMKVEGEEYKNTVSQRADMGKAVGPIQLYEKIKELIQDYGTSYGCTSVIVSGLRDYNVFLEIVNKYAGHLQVIVLESPNAPKAAKAIDDELGVGRILKDLEELKNSGLKVLNFTTNIEKEVEQG